MENAFFCKKNICKSNTAQNNLWQYRTKIVRQMRRQIFRQMKQKAEWILDVFTSIFVKYESLFRIWRMQIASSDFLRDEGKNGENPLWIFEYFPEISRKICTQDACGKIRNRLWREICKQMACKVARRSLCGIALGKHGIKLVQCCHYLDFFTAATIAFTICTRIIEPKLKP